MASLCAKWYHATTHMLNTVLSPVTIPLSRPSVNEEDIEEVVSVLRSPQLSLGPKLPEFEERMAAYVGTTYAIAVNSGTSALHLCVRALGIGEGDEVITTPFSFVASANCILFERAIPRFVDIEPDTYCIDPNKIEQTVTEKTRAILGVDVFGYLCNWDALRAIAEKHNLALIEDSCEALGSRRMSYPLPRPLPHCGRGGGRMAGTLADCATFAFYPNKQMTTGEGGMLVTDRDDIARLARSMRNQGRSEDDAWLVHERLGYNYRLSDINCALGISQLRRIEEFITKRAEVVSWYREALAPFEDSIVVPTEQPRVRMSWFVFAARLTEHFHEEDRNQLLRFLRERGIGCSNYFPPIHLQPFYMQKFGFRKGNFPMTEHVAERTISLPFATDMSREEVVTVCNILKDGLSHLSYPTL